MTILGGTNVNTDRRKKKGAVKGQRGKKKLTQGH